MPDSTDDRLRLHIEAAERLYEEIQGIRDDIRDRFALMKSEGYDVRIIRKVIKLRKMSPHDRAEMDAILNTYCCAVGLQLDLPLATAA